MLAFPRASSLPSTRVRGIGRSMESPMMTAQIESQASALAASVPASTVRTKPLAPSCCWTEPLARISTGKTLVRYGDADVIFLQGEPADSLYFLSQGTVRLLVITDDGREAIVATQM